MPYVISIVGDPNGTAAVLAAGITGLFGLVGTAIMSNQTRSRTASSNIQDMQAQIRDLTEKITVLEARMDEHRRGDK
jgi:hypothetical protein